jgi:hypothetical protein
VVEGVDAGAETSVQAEDLAVDERGEGQVVEQILNNSNQKFEATSRFY